MLVAAEVVADGDSGYAAGSEPDRDVDRDKGSHTGRDLSSTMLLREFIFCGALALTTFGALHTSPPKISRHPPATRFFPGDSPVKDWYRGELGPALAAAAQADVSLVMYYAPWDAECQHVRREFDIAARLLGDQVYFAAINCWHPGSECRLQHNKIPSWPVIMAYTVNSKGVLYRGPRDAHSLVKFAQLVSTPLKRVSSMADLIHLVAVCDAVVLGSTPLTLTSEYYNTWYSTALKWRQSDPLGHLCLAVATSEELAEELAGGRAPALRMILFNTTVDYEGGAENWTENQLTEWMRREHMQVAANLAPAWHKSSTLASYVGDGSVLILFTPLDSLYPQLPAYDLLREVAMEYHDCAGSAWTQEIVRLQQLQRRLYSPADVHAACDALNTTRPAYTKVVTDAKSPWHNATFKKSNKNSLYSMLIKNNMVRTVGSGKMDYLFIGPREECGNSDNLHEDEEPQFRFKNRQQTLMLAREDERAPAQLLARHARFACRLLRFAARRSAPHIPRTQNYTTVRGLACQTNETLSFIAIDSIRNHHFAESLGIDITKREDKTAVVILHKRMESQYELREVYGEASLRDMVRNFTEGRLRRALRSAVERALHTHGYTADHSGGLRVQELSTRTFARFVNKSGETSVVLVCGGACPSHVTRAALAAARLLARYAVRCRTARIDAHRHDLPWQYTVDAHPAVLVFPADRRLESGSYPRGERVTSAGVVALVARTLGAPTQLKLQLALCNNAAYTEAKRKCLLELRIQAERLIERVLQHWRRHAGTRAPLQKLASLREVGWALHELHESYLSPGDHRQDKLLASLHRLEGAWHREPTIHSEL